MRHYRKFSETLGALDGLGGHSPQIHGGTDSPSRPEIGTHSPPKAPKPPKPPKLDWLAGETKLSESEEERAAIIEYDGGAPRAWAEALARLDPNKPPGDVPPKRWLKFVDDCGKFIDDGWATSAERLGWGPLDLFGCDRTKPLARINRAGLLWLLNGRKLLVLSADAAAIATASGGYLTSRPRISDLDGVLAWELPLHKCPSSVCHASDVVRDER